MLWFKPEYCWNFELGSYLNLIDNKLNASFSLFYMNIKDIFRICLVIITFFATSPVFSQQNIDRQVTLVRPYEPSVADAQKITVLPNLRDTFSISPTFLYAIEPKRIDTRFDVIPITPARLRPLPQTRLYNSYIKLGAGTIPNAQAEVALNTLRNRNYSAGVLANLDMSGGNVILTDNRLPNGDKHKVYAGYNDLAIKAFGQRFFRNNTILSGDLRAALQTAHNYGYDPKIIDSIPTFSLESSDIRKNYIFTDANIGFRSSYYKTSQMNYDVKLGYKSVRNKFEEKIYNENAFNFKAQLDNNMFGGNINMDLYNRGDAFDHLRKNFALDINPWFALDNDSIRMKIGVGVFLYNEEREKKDASGNPVYENELQYWFFPKIDFQFTLLKDIFIPFLGIDASQNNTTYRDLVLENPFILPGQVAKISRNKLNLYAGLKGTLTSKLSYYLRADFSQIARDYFFVNDTIPSHRNYDHINGHIVNNVQYKNHFVVVYEDDVKKATNVLRVKGELYFNPIENLDIALKVSYFNYNPPANPDIKKAWHRPNFTLDFSAKYAINNKILLNFDVMGIGERYAPSFDSINAPPIKLPTVFVFNVGGEYRYARNFSIFLKLNNLTGAKYHRWNFYPSYRFNAMAGFTYSL
jgi:hypothetical protein